ncbi:MAG: DNA repair protein RecN [Candidatus Auribacterota bacterium]|jgi:DNA repair protein RecN (Recombination protein N)|nr:DNA repair protein RecN [Candidatus Auribacterota bacterium]
MLKELRIKNLILVKDVSITFGEGLNIITGETGAGKSVIIGSLKLILGERSSTDIIRTGEDKSTVEAVFDILDNNPVKDILNQAGIDLEDDLLIIKRDIYRDKTNRQYINGSPVPLSTLKELGEFLIDIHGQHDHQSLFNTDMHRTFLDWFADLRRKVDQFQIDFQKYMSLDTQLKKLIGQQEKNDQNRRIWQYELQEIRQANLSIDEEETLDQEYTRCSHAREIQEKCYDLYEILYERDNSVRDTLGVATRILEELSAFDESFHKKTEICGQISALIDDLSQEIRAEAERSEVNPVLLKELEDRIGVIEKLKRKFKMTLPQLLQYAQNLDENLKSDTIQYEKIESLKNECEKIFKQLTSIAGEISKRRTDSAPELCKKIEEEFKQLDMPDARLHISITHCDSLTETGFDHVEYMFAPNRGETWSPLKNTASGGEISRIMLALKSTFATADNISTMIFDEIDVNLGGKTAGKVGQRLSALSRNHQVICITHLPQIASCAKKHFKVEKSIIGDRTVTTIIDLNIEQRIDEIARMLGGELVTSVAKIHAKELIEKNNGADRYE